MRDIKFRAWDKKKNDWFNDNNGSLFIELDGYINFGWSGEIMDDYTDRIILMQYTGKKDINDVEIYEGDIVHDDEVIYLVGFGVFTDDNDFQEPAQGQTGFYIVDIHTDETFPFYSMRYKVIGNAYENKGLLEEWL